jgi:UDP-glucose 4-epimerase
MISTLAGKRCLVIGAGGFIGGHLCDELALVGAHVSAFGRRPRFPILRMPDVWFECDAGDIEALRGALADTDIVFHLLGSADPSASNRNVSNALLEAITTDGTIIDMCIAQQVERLVFVSSGGTVYGPAQYLPIDEGHPTNPLSAYGVAKLCVEKLLQLQNQLSDLDYVTLRVANPYGPRQDPHRGQGIVPKLLYRAMLDKPIDIWGDGSAVRDYIYISDLVRAIVAASTATLPLERTFNIGSGTGRSVNDILTAAEMLLIRRVQRLHLPQNSGMVLANVLDCSRAHAMLDWHPTVEWHDGLSQTLAWITSYYGPLEGLSHDKPVA